MPQEHSVTLDTIGGGALSELFAMELARILANIADPNTDEKTKRRIDISVSFKPKDRGVADVEMTCTAKLAPISKVSTQVFMGRVAGKLVAVENDPRQSSLFDQPKPLSVAAFSEARS